MRALAVIMNWGRKNDSYLARLLQEYRSMSFDVDVIILSNIDKDVAPDVSVVVPDQRSKLPLSRMAAAARYPWSIGPVFREWKRHMDLPFAHRELFAQRKAEYDLFIFSEDDTLITEKSLRGFHEVSACLREDEVPGFLRFEECPGGGRNYPEVHGHFHWDPTSVRSRGKYTLASFTNAHAACYVLTREQLQRAIDSGGYLVEPHAGKYDMLCTAATDPYTQCGLQKVICISHLDDFLIHHLPNVYVGTEFGVDDAELRRQVDVLHRLGENGQRGGVLFDTESKVGLGRYSKSYYEPAMPEVIQTIPEGVKSVLSIGCGWGALEASLVAKGMQVTAIPLDPVIAGCAQAKGIDIVLGEFGEASKMLGDRQFDCLLFSNVLHLVPDPVGVLDCFGKHLSPGGSVIAVSPNTARPGTTRAIGRVNGVRDSEIYQTTGIHHSSHRTVNKWFRDAGMRVEEFKDLLDTRAQGYGRMALGLLDSFIAWQFIAVARKQSDRRAAAGV